MLQYSVPIAIAGSAPSWLDEVKWRPPESLPGKAICSLPYFQWADAAVAGNDGDDNDD